jgi:hypothetical protein
MRWIALGGFLLLAAACEKRTVPPDVAADSVAADSAARDSVRRDSTPPIIGYDSAFGPLFAVDSLGRKVALPPRRP